MDLSTLFPLPGRHQSGSGELPEYSLFGPVGNNPAGERLVKRDDQALRGLPAEARVLGLLREEGDHKPGLRVNNLGVIDPLAAIQGVSGYQSPLVWAHFDRAPADAHQSRCRAGCSEG